ncbi:RNA 2',3'-cyclic phosphodiesterase [Pseudoalteromonas phenolica]|uniref:RNA 2',3'-cyclic phosphodiesterase n=1 Tax=Pseudoalteromonas phenolica TaxID=161398 RepID=A0A5R9PYS7_9GAMM|nr:RNA 2',3'-cyclic phosphodiesterase [Pseudoalteromonas phenolica]TLX46001.1 RNA 2',3'-cyclic phosphodiesterase [Pseudoalteromonas phenolica]
MLNESKRLFFGIGLDDVAKEHIKAWLDSSVVGKKPHTKVQNWHLTLAFLPNVQPDQQNQLVAFARSLQVAPFSLKFSETGYWPHNGIFYLQPDSIPKPLSMLAEPLRDKGSELDIYHNPFSFAPHITLFRSHKPCPEVAQTIPPFSLTVKQFHLYHSYQCKEYGLVYEPIETFLLNGEGES